MENKTIHGSKITAAYRSEYDKRLTRVWCEDGSLHLVTGYQANKLSEDPSFDSVVGYWEKDGELWFGEGVKEIVTRPFYLNA